MLQKPQAGQGHVQAGGCGGLSSGARGERKERGGRASPQRLARDAPLSKIHICEAEPERGCGFPFKGLYPKRTSPVRYTEHWGEAVLLSVRAQALESARLLAVRLRICDGSSLGLC